MEDYRISDWTYDTSTGVELGVGALVLSGGMLSLKDPYGKPNHFHYGGIGSGFSVSKGLTKIEIPPTFVQNHLLSGSGAYSRFEGTCTVLMTPTFKGKELAKADLCGVAAYLETGGSVIAGYGVTVMYLGLNPLLLLPSLSVPMLTRLLSVAILEAPVVLLMRGTNMGTSVSVGVNGVLGMFH